LRLRPVLPLLLAALAGHTAAPRQPPYVPAWTMVALDLDVTPEPAAGRLTVAGRTRLRLDADSAAEVVLELNTRGPVTRFVTASVEDERGRARLNLKVPEDTAALLARLPLGRIRHRGDTVEVSYRTVTRGASSQLLVRPKLALGSWVEQWYPTPQSDEGFTATRGAAPGLTRLHLPAGWRALTNGNRADRRESGRGAIETWRIDDAVARSFIAAPYIAVTRRSGSREIGFYVLGDRAASAEAQATVLARAIEAEEARFGPYPYRSYAVAEVPDSAVSWSASSEQGFIIANSSIMADTVGNLPLFAHEAAHGWWGNAVNTSGPGAMMGSEALAQYGAVIAIEALEGDSAMRQFLRFSRPGYNPLQCALGYFHIWRQGGDRPLAKLDDAQWDHNLADSKGMWFYQMMREELGDERFFAALRGLLQRFRGRAMTLDDIRAAFLHAAPDSAALAPVLAQWLDRAGAPVIDLDWWSLRRKDKPGLALRLRQRQTGAPYRLRLEVGVRTDEGDTIVPVTLDDTAASIDLDMKGRPLEVRLDPRYRLLLWRPEYGARPPS
jgi:aminopeptidase N